MYRYAPLPGTGRLRLRYRREKVVELVLALASTLEGDMITRGDMAILLDGSLDYLEYLQTL